MSWPILVVEDDAAIREELVEVLAARGFRPLGAANGAEAISVAGELGFRPAVIVLDLVMPIMDGLEFLDRQPEVPMLDGVPVIILTAQSGRARPLTPTVCAVLEKPVRLPRLLALVHDACHGARS